MEESKDLTASEIIKEHLYANRYAYLMLVLVLVLCVIPLSLVPQPKGHDIYFHLYRIDSLADELAAGNIPARIYHTVYNGVGYGSPLFYGDWMLYIPAALVNSGVSVILAYKLNIMLVTFLTAFISFFSARAMFSDEKAAFTAAVVYTFSGYFAIDTYTRAAVGEMTAFAFVPLVFMGAYSVFKGDSRRWIWLPVGLTFLLVSHVLSAAVAAVLLAVLFLCFLPQMIRQPRRFLLLGASVAVFAALSASFLFPMLEQFSSGTFLSTDGTSATAYGTLEQRALPLWAALSDFNIRFDYKITNNGFWIPNGLGMSFFVMAAGLVYCIRKQKSKKDCIVWCAACVVTLFMTTELFPWEILQPYLGVIQFPWRLLLFSVLFMALFAGRLVAGAAKKSHASCFAALFAAFSLFSYISAASVSLINYASYQYAGYEITYPYENNIGVGEFLPSYDLPASSYRSALLRRNGRVTTNNPELAGTLEVTRGHGSVTVRFEGNNESDTYFDVPLLMYKGYAAYAELGDGTRIELPVGYGDYNLVRVNLQSVVNGQVTVYYEGTAVQKASFVITVAAFVLLIVYLVLSYVISRRKGAPAPGGEPAEIPGGDDIPGGRTENPDGGQTDISSDTVASE